MKKFFSLQFEPVVLDEIQNLYNNLESFLDDIEDAESSSDDDVKIFSTLYELLDSEDVKVKIRVVMNMLSELKDLL